MSAEKKNQMAKNPKTVPLDYESPTIDEMVRESARRRGHDLSDWLTTSQMVKELTTPPNYHLGVPYSTLTFGQRSPDQHITGCAGYVTAHGTTYLYNTPFTG